MTIPEADDLPSDWLWHQQQNNYFYGLAEAFSVDAQGLRYRRRWPLKPAPDSLPAWQSEEHLARMNCLGYRA